MGLSALSSQKVVSDWNHIRVWVFGLCSLKNESYDSGMTIFSERSFKYLFIQITVMNQAMMFSFWTLGRYLRYLPSVQKENIWIPSFLGIPRNSQKFPVMQMTLANWIPSFLERMMVQSFLRFICQFAKWIKQSFAPSLHHSLSLKEILLLLKSR